MGLYFNTIYYLILAKILIILIARLFYFLCTFLVGVILRKSRWHELKITTIQLLIDKLINELADCLSIARAYMVGLDVLDIGQTALLQICEQFFDCLVGLSFEVPEVDEDALLLALNTNGIRTCLIWRQMRKEIRG